MKTDIRKPKRVIGRAEVIKLPEVGATEVPARIDTGANTSAIWATNIVEQNGVLSFTLFGIESPLFSGHVHHMHDFDRVIVASSNGIEQERYKVRLLITLKGRRIRARFTLADRSTQTYPVLVGRNVLRGKFIVDVTRGRAQSEAESLRSEELQAKLSTKDHV